jgi:hypothetical protein
MMLLLRGSTVQPEFPSYIPLVLTYQRLNISTATHQTYHHLSCILLVILITHLCMTMCFRIHLFLVFTYMPLSLSFADGADG